jgi:hypothetical protein
MALREVFADIALKVTGQGAVKQANDSVDSLASAATGLVAAFAGNALLDGIKGFAEELDTLDDLSAQTKVSTDALQTWGYAAQLSGSSAVEFNRGLELLQKGLGNADAATSAQAKALESLGVAFKGANGEVKPLAEILPDVLATFSSLPSDAKKAEVATALFGRAGVRMIPTLERGREGMAALRAEMEEFGGPVADDTIASAGEFKDSLAKLDLAGTALKGTLAKALFPQLANLFTSIARGVGTLSNFTRGTTLADNAGFALAATLAGPVLGALRPFLGKGLKFAAIYGAVDDVIGFLNGKDSIIEDLLDGAFGHGTADQVRDWANDAIDQFGYFVENADAAYATLESSQATTFQRMMAGVGLLANGSVDTFAAISEGWESIMLDMSIAIDEFVLGVGTAWNQMISDMVGNAGPLSGILDFLKVDDKSSSLVNEDGLAARRARKDDLQKRAHERETGQGEFAAGRRGENARKRSSEETRGFDGLTATEREHNRTARPGEAIAPRTTRRGRVNAERAEQAAAGERAGQATATIDKAAAAGTTLQFNDNKSLSFTFPKGTSASDQAQIVQAVKDVMRAGNREAVQALTQRGTK